MKLRFGRVFVLCHVSKHLSSLVLQVLTALSKVDDWQFDMFALERATSGRPLSLLAFALIQRAQLSQLFGINENKLVR